LPETRIASFRETRLHKRGIYRCAICSLSLLCWSRLRSRRRRRTRIFLACLGLIAAAATTVVADITVAAAPVADAPARRAVAANKDVVASPAADANRPAGAA